MQVPPAVGRMLAISLPWGLSSGRPIAEWKALIRASTLTKHMELVGWLKADYGLGHGHANALVAHTLSEI